MAATHKKQLTTTVRPGSLLSNQDIIAVITADTDIGGRIASVNDLRFSTAAGLWLEWMPIAFSLVGGSLTATFRIVRPTILSSEDLVTEIHYGGTPDGSAPGPASTLSLTGLVGAWDCESANPSDWSGNGNNGAGNGGLGTTTGKTGSAINLDGNDDWCNLGNDSSLKPTAELTAMLWLRPDSVGDSFDKLLIHSGLDETSYPASYRGYGLFRVSATKQIASNVVFGNGVHPAAISTAIADNGEWTHIAMTYTAGLLTVFVNGVLSGSTVTAASAIAYSAANVEIGRRKRASTYHYFDGPTDDARIYSRDLTVDEIAYHVSQVNSPGTWGPEIALSTSKPWILGTRINHHIGIGLGA